MRTATNQRIYNSALIPQHSVLVVALCAMLVALCSSAQAQPAKKIPHIGYLRFIEVPVYDAAFRQGLRELGYVEGQNIYVEYRFAGGSIDRVAEFAAELVRPCSSRDMRVPSRPGGNLTGLSTVNPDAAAKRVELMKEIMPRISRLAVLRNPTNSGSQLALKETEAGAKRLSIRLQVLEARSGNELAAAFYAAGTERAQALIVLADALFFAQRNQVVDFGIKHRLPSMFDDAPSVEAGGMISYGANLAELFRRSAVYVDKILKGAKPADIPVEQPTKFELIVNLKAAKQIGLTIPPNVLARADKVIQ